MNKIQMPTYVDMNVVIGNIYSLLVGMQIGAATVEATVDVPHEPRNRVNLC